jgi:uncharacterized membrane protein YgaE (UPF0421/DUF939 family)
MLSHFRLTRNAVIHAVTLAVSCVSSYWLITHLLCGTFSVSRGDDLLGGMWASVATLFVYRFSYEQSIGAALTRMAATSASFALCLIYLLLFPFHLWGLAVMVATSALVMSIIGRPDDIMTAAITTVVVMVVAAISPQHAWLQPILRLVDTLVGVGVGVVAAWFSLREDAPSALTSRRIKMG